MKLYTMTMKENPNHLLRGTWEFDRYWNITKVSQLNLIVKRLSSWTKSDKTGRILCVGFPASSITLQQRIFIAKMGHDGFLWSKKTPLCDEVAAKLIPAK